MPRIPFTVYGPTQGYFISCLHDYRTLAYTLGHSGTLDVPDGPAGTERVLSRIFAEGNGHGDGRGFTVGGRSMSSGDVVTWRGSASGSARRSGGHGSTRRTPRGFPSLDRASA